MSRLTNDFSKLLFSEFTSSSRKIILPLALIVLVLVGIFTADALILVLFSLLSFFHEARRIVSSHDVRGVDVTIAISVPVPFVMISVTCADAMTAVSLLFNKLFLLVSVAVTSISESHLFVIFDDDVLLSIVNETLSVLSFLCGWKSTSPILTDTV